MSQESFDLDFGAPKRKKRREGDHTTKERAAQAATWTRLESVARPKCADCLAEMAGGGKWKAPDPAVWERDDGLTSLAFCWDHGARHRTADGLPGKPKGMVQH